MSLISTEEPKQTTIEVSSSNDIQTRDFSSTSTSPLSSRQDSPLCENMHVRSEMEPSLPNSNPHPNRHHHSPHVDHSSSQRPMDLAFSNITVKMPVEKKSSSSFLLPLGKAFKQVSDKSLTTPKDFILQDITGYARAGQVLGIMGPSGSGKTTLLSTLSGRGKLASGCITINGDPLSKQLRRKICYVLQQDVFFSDLTVRQTLIYTALLRLPDTLSFEKKSKLVDHIIDVLDLRDCQHTIMGDMMKRGLSGGEKKRASIACELLTNPTILLIDEPTSGLDSSTAFSLVQLLKNFAVRERKTVILTIHQPSSQIFYTFDNLLLLAGGRSAYFGDVHSVVPFFSNIGFPMTPHFNPADFIMEKIKGKKEDVTKIIAAADKLQKLPPSPQVPSICKSYRNKPSLDKETATDSCDIRGISIFRSSGQDSQDSQETNPLWSGEDGEGCHESNHPLVENCLPADLELQVIIECPEKSSLPNQNDNAENGSQKPSHDHHFHNAYQISPSGAGRDSDSGRSSLTDMDRSSMATFSSSSSTSSCSDEMYFDFSHNNKTNQENKVKRHRSHSNIIRHNHRKSHHHRSPRVTNDKKWPTSFWTQLHVLTMRNFYEARGRMLSKLNFVQTIVLALVTGSIWYQIPRTEETLNDVKGWMFFSMTYWMLFALFNALVSFPGEREVINKERSSGSYRLSSYYLAKMIGELPLTIVMPSLFHLISYPLLGLPNFQTFFVLWAFQILSSLVSQSVGLLVGASCTDLEVSITISALYSMSSILFGGFYSATMPHWLHWIRYLSIVFYAFQSMQMIEFSLGSPILCSLSKSKFDSCLDTTQNKTSMEHSAFIPYDELRRHLDISSVGTEPLPIWLNTTILLVFLFVFRLAGYLVLRYIRKPK